MKYYFSKIIEGDFANVIQKVEGLLKEEGFGVLTEIDVKETLKKKIDVEFRNYRILGACNPNFAYQALQLEDKIGVMLPCNVVVQELEDGRIEIFAIDPITTMEVVNNPELLKIANQVAEKFQKIIDSL